MRVRRPARLPAAGDVGQWAAWRRAMGLVDVLASPVMASRRGLKGVDLNDVDGLLDEAKNIRQKYKALKKQWGDSKDGKPIAAAEIRRLADDLKRAIAEAHAGCASPVLSVVPSHASPVVSARTPPTPRLPRKTVTNTPQAGRVSRRASGRPRSEAARVAALPPPSQEAHVETAAPRLPPVLAVQPAEPVGSFAPAPHHRVEAIVRTAVDLWRRFAPRTLVARW
jgi:hypothetical protein